ncbi:hypothetical protein [Caballeronia sp. LZ034LL]|uniref:hypothetical protein n=1 Tax=Caballeronia sp. LZ034LL TaxID=3038567 RepID=UPI002863120B|nr:hypothetical protein [Caballeronia sp. LZ034LL]MDR5839328.1 hypothetical protein [Caballeronia sp. LZ034LL]
MNQYNLSIEFEDEASNEIFDVSFVPFFKGDTGPQGEPGKDGKDGSNGTNGTNGTNGSNGHDGAPGKSAYEVWVAAGHTGTVADFLGSLQGKPGLDGEDGADGKDGTNGKDGTDGTNGTNGVDGHDGQSTYALWLALGNTGTQADFIAAQRGPAGADGKDGVDGKDGAAGTGLTNRQVWVSGTTYNPSDYTFSPNSSGNTSMWIAKGSTPYLSTIAPKDDPTHWVEFQAPAGADGKSVELQKTSTAVQWRQTGGNWADLFTLASVTGTNGTNGTDGADGKDGKGVSTVAVTYQAGTSGTSAPSGSWVSAVPAVTKGQFLWTRTVTTLTDATSVTAYSVAYQPLDGAKGADGTNGTNGTDGADGDAGAAGRGIQSVAVTYQMSASGTTTPTGTWTSTIPTLTKGQYLWVRTVLTLTDTTTVTSYNVSYQGADGAKGTDGTSPNLASPGAIGSTTPGSGKFTDLTATGTLTGFPGRLLNVRVITATQVYNKTAGTNAVIVEAIGGGGGGGGVPAAASSQSATAGGGSAGSYAKVYLTSGFDGVTVTIGAPGAGGPAGGAGTAGGTTSFGSLITCPGGNGAAAGWSVTLLNTFPNASPPVAPTVTAGAVLAAFAGWSGFMVGLVTTPGSFSTSGYGANSPLGQGGVPRATAAPGLPGSGYGAGGSGGNAPAGGNAAQKGGDGTQGVCLVYEFA